MTDLNSIVEKRGRDCILLGYRGSVAHGMYIPSDDPNSVDDIDLMGVAVPGESYYLGLDSYPYGLRGTKEIKDGEWDIVIYEAKKMISLLANGNPNVLSLLWLNDYIKTTSEGELLVANRRLFSTKRVYDSFIGYAYGQRKRMTHLAFEGYMGEKRKSLVMKHGYDTKNAAHLIRLLRTVIEFLPSGELVVNRSGIDADELIGIKRGQWTLEQVHLEAERLLGLAAEAYDKCSLPEYTDMDAVNKLCISIVKSKLAKEEQ